MKAQIKRVSYVEPAHTHDSWHSILVTKGRMCVAGKDLRPGDYVFGWDILPDELESTRRLLGGTRSVQLTRRARTRRAVPPGHGGED